MTSIPIFGPCKLIVLEIKYILEICQKLLNPLQIPSSIMSHLSVYAMDYYIWLISLRFLGYKVNSFQLTKNILTKINMKIITTKESNITLLNHCSKHINV